MAKKRRISWAEARRKVQELIQHATPAGMEVEIHAWDDDVCERDGLGPRVAEVSFWHPTVPGAATGSGSSFMQVDNPAGAAVCLAVERLMICYRMQDEAEEIAEHEWRLRDVIGLPHPS